MGLKAIFLSVPPSTPSKMFQGAGQGQHIALGGRSSRRERLSIVRHLWEEGLDRRQGGPSPSGER